MKFAAIYIIATILTTGFALANKPLMNASLVGEIGAIILKQDSYECFRDGFVIKNPQFDAKERVWRFQTKGKLDPVFPGSLIYFFEIRDSDGHFRIGSISGHGYSPKNAGKFRMSPRIHGNLRSLNYK